MGRASTEQSVGAKRGSDICRTPSTSRLYHASRELQNPLIPGEVVGVHSGDGDDQHGDQIGYLSLRTPSHPQLLVVAQQLTPWTGATQRVGLARILLNRLRRVGPERTPSPRGAN
jgi:hypothetical protein